MLKNYKIYFWYNIIFFTVFGIGNFIFIYDFVSNEILYFFIRVIWIFGMLLLHCFVSGKILGINVFKLLFKPDYLEDLN